MIMDSLDRKLAEINILPGSMMKRNFDHRRQWHLNTELKILEPVQTSAGPPLDVLELSKV